MTTESQSLDRAKGIAMMLYGIPGAEKTRLLGTGRTLIIRPPSEHTDSIDLNTRAEEIVAQDWDDMFGTFQKIQQGKFSDFDWIAYDGISLGQDHLLEDVLADAIARKPTRGMTKGGLIVPEYGADQGEYKINFDRITKWTRDMVALAKEGKFHFVMTAHPFEWWDPEKEKDVWAPWVQGKNMSPKICGYMNVVAYLRKVEEKGSSPKTILTVDSEGFVGKDQFHCFPKLKSGRHGFINPTLDQIVEAWAKTRKPAAKKRTAPKRSKQTTRKTTKRRSRK